MMLYELVDMWMESEECYFNGILNEEDRIDITEVDKEKAAEDLYNFSFGALESMITKEQAKKAVECVIDYLEDNYQTGMSWQKYIQEPLQDIDIGDALHV